MEELKIKNQSKSLNISDLVKHLYKKGSDPPTLWIGKAGDNLSLTCYWKDPSSFWGNEGEFHILSYKVEGLKDLIGSFLGDYITTNLDAKLRDYTNTANLNTKLGDYAKTDGIANQDKVYLIFEK